MPDNGLIITELDRGRIPAWEKYVNDTPHATYFHRHEWKDIIEESFGHKTRYLMLAENGKVRGILPLVHVKSPLFGSILCSMPFLNYGGICADDEMAEDMLLKKAQLILKETGGDYLELRQVKKVAADLPHKLSKISLSVELSPDPETVWNKFDRKHRSNIRRSEKNGFEIKFGGKELMPEFYSLMMKGWKEHGTPFYSYKFFSNLAGRLGDSIGIYMISHGGMPIATAMNGYFRDTVEGLWLTQLHEYSKLQAGYVLYWEMIRRSCEMGFRTFNLGRSSADSGGELFKKKWNASPRQLYWEYLLNKRKRLPELNVDNPRYQLAMKVWRKLPAGITNAIGPHIAKQIP